MQVASSLGSEGKNWDDYILVSQDGDLQPTDGGGGGGRAAAERTPPIRRGRGLVRMEPEGAAGTFHDPLMAGTTSGSSSPDEGSTHSKDSDFTIVNPNDLWTSRTALPPSLPPSYVISHSEDALHKSKTDLGSEGGISRSSCRLKVLHMWTVTHPVTNTLYSVSLPVICATWLLSELMLYAISST